MSLWDQISQRANLRKLMEEYYEQKYQFLLRCTFAKWIETAILSEGQLADSEPVFKQVAKNFVSALKSELHKTYPHAGIERILETIDQYPEEDYYRHLRNGIGQELQLIDMATRNGNHTNEINNQILELRQNLTTIVAKEKNLQSHCDLLQNHYNEYKRIEMNNPANIEFQDQMKILNDQYRDLLSTKELLTSEIRIFVGRYEELQHTVTNIELKTWQRSQALAGNGQPFRDNLDEIQSWIENLVEIVGTARDLINNMLTYCQRYTIKLGDESILTNLAGQVMQMQEHLIISSFIVEKQPPQVMKTNTRFAANVRWLIGPQLGIGKNSPKVECVILSEAHAQRHFSQPSMHDDPQRSSGEILNNSSTMELQPNKHLSASFRNMQLKNIKRAEKKGTESVMDEKFALLFYTSTLFGNEYRIRAWTLSLPVVVIVHGNQESQSWATITWDNAFAEMNREPFQVPDRVPWSHLSLALNTKFQSQTKRSLTDDNMRFLCEKIFRNEYMGDDSKNYITWSQFCKEPLPERNFTFWDWFWQIMKLTKDHLLGPWQAGHIVGFINKKETIEQMKMSQEGTFLLRFSDSELGGITIAWVSGSEVLMLQPWTAKDLNVRGLADRINDLVQLRYLHPSMNKDVAFSSFYSPSSGEQPRSDGYVKNIIIAHVPGYPENSHSYPNTPQHSMQSPNPANELVASGSSSMYNPDIDFDINSIGSMW